MRKTLLQIIAFSLAATAAAQSDAGKAEKLLDQAASAYETAMAIEADFTLTRLKGKQEQGRTSGKMLLSKGKMRVETDETLVWFDGTDMWTMQKGDNEVSLTCPTDDEKRDLNPYTYLRLYRQGYTCKTKKGRLSDGSQGNKIFLNTNDPSAPIREAYIETNAANELVRVSFRRETDDWTRIVFGKLAIHGNADASAFSFPSNIYPDVEVVDLRD